MIRIPLPVLFNFPQELHLSAFAKKRSAMDQIETYLRGKYLWIIGFSLRIINHSPFLWWDWGGYHSFWLFCRRDLCMHGSLFSRHTSTLRNTCSSVCHDFQFMTFRTWKLLLVAWHAWHTWHAWNEGACGFHNRYFIPGTVQCTLLWDSTTLHYHVTSYQVPGVYMKLMQQEIPPIYLRKVHVKAWYVTSSQKMVKNIKSVKNKSVIWFSIKLWTSFACFTALFDNY